jgi:hypothetical protein
VAVWGVGFAGYFESELVKVGALTDGEVRHEEEGNG